MSISIEAGKKRTHQLMLSSVALDSSPRIKGDADEENACELLDEELRGTHCWHRWVVGV